MHLDKTAGVSQQLYCRLENQTWDALGLGIM